MSKGRVNVPMQAFIQACLSSKSNAEVAEATGLTQGSVQARRSKYRKLGIKLPTFQRGGGARLDIEAANALIEQFANEGEAE